MADQQQAALAHISHRHLVMATSMLIALTLSLLLLPGRHAEAAKRTAIPLSLELTPKAEFGDPAGNTLPESLPWRTFEVKSGDNLSLIFSRAGLGPRDVHEVVTRSTQAKPLGSLRPGQSLSFQIDDSGALQAIHYQLDPLNSLLYERSVDGFSTTRVAKQPDIRYRSATATIKHSLYVAAREAQMPENLIMELANIFGGVLDFVYDVRAGDYFVVIFEDLYVDGEPLGTGEIVAAEYVNQGTRYKAFRYANTRGETGYYGEDGVSMRKAFLRAPLDFVRISSGFNPKRLHPVFKTVRPHRGIDYAAPRGTPVYAAGDGRVIESGYSTANGNYVFLQHGQGYETKYLHLDKRAVRNGQKVSQRQIIGWVGSTGYATGPHLHYEFLMNGVHRNPRTIVEQLPKARSISTVEMPRYLQMISGMQLQLATYAAQHQYSETQTAQATQAGGAG